MIEYLYGDDYMIYPLYVDCADQGHFGVARARVYCICAHKARTTILLDPEDVYRVVTRLVTRHVRTRPSDYFVATHNEIMRSASLLATKRKRPFTFALQPNEEQCFERPVFACFVSLPASQY